MQGCNLRCTGTGLSHLFAPLVTFATLQAPHSRGVPAAAGAGVLTVVETKIRVGSSVKPPHLRYVLWIDHRMIC